MIARSASTGRGSHDLTAAPSSDLRPPGEARTLAFPRAGRRSTPRLLHVYVATAPRPDAAPSLVFVDEAARVLDRIPIERIAHGAGAAPSLLSFRGIIYALWKARRLGYRRVAVHSDDPAAVAQINGERDVDPDAVGSYLEARALMHLYTSARIDVGELVLSGVLEPWGQPASLTGRATPASF